ncbi:VOC family protein [Roseibium aestuarii]|uniref:VOC family protein n=1 Tax=Roseibium aestuarii TaxID=2600299 RepID=A0ABW4JS21_9HYPH|nr:VOC family protein [Roseibium aestuarii]
MEQRLSLITLVVDDIATTRRFLTDGLGWTAHGPSNDEVAFFPLNGMVLGLYARPKLEEELGHPAPAGVHGHSCSIAWNGRSQADVDEMFEKAHAAGAKVIKPPHGTHWGGYSCYLEMPGGHMLELAFNPFWTIAEDGSVRLD